MRRQKFKTPKKGQSSAVNTMMNYLSVTKNTENVNPNNATPEPKKDIKEESEDEIIVKNPKKRNCHILSESDSDDEQSHTPKRKITVKKVKRLPVDETETEMKSIPLKLIDFDKSSTITVDRLKRDVDSPSVSKPNTSTMPMTKWTHENLEFLQPDKIRDINKNRPNHPEYDSRTLYVPESYLNTLTPAMRQWWVLKSKHYDAVLFFKLGKFYELYHMDATVGVNHLGFTYMRGEFAHAGFPESAYGRMAGALIELGFKVARVEQTETPEMMERRNKEHRLTKYEKIIRREICQISTKGTCVYGAQLPDTERPMSSYMMAVKEMIKDNICVYGVCFVDVSIGTFHLGEFTDDKHNSNLLTLITQHPPALLLLERGNLQETTMRLIKQLIDNVRIEMLAPEKQFYNANKTAKCLKEGCYFKDDSGEIMLPESLNNILAKSNEYENALKALGACIWYLEDSELDIQTLSMGQFEIYKPIDSENVSARKMMILDSITIENLKLLGGYGTLQKSLDYCQTAFGKRLLQQWICKPLCDVHNIVARQNAVKELYDHPIVLQNAREILKKLPDLERQISKIHSFGNKLLVENHPDGRAVMYEGVTYSKRKILDLINTLEAFETCQSIRAIFEGSNSKLLKKLTQSGENNMFLNLTPILQYFKDAFDHKAAKKDGKIVPQPGVDEHYDGVNEEIRSINEELEEYLSKQRRFFDCQVKYFGTDKKRFQIEVPDNKTHKVNDDYQIEGSRKGFKRYSTARTKELLAKMMKVESSRINIIADLNRKVFEKFSKKKSEWDQVTHCLMMLDVLCAFAEYARTYADDICVPILHDFCEKPMLKIENGRHPCITNIENFVPNDTLFGTNDNAANILILTGPNMGGKSTLMRQASLIIIMAHIGSFVPAAYCEMSVVDRIFTRIGAHDDILKGQSTFLVELTEAAVILNRATKHSFVLIDELGRGTSTHDGNAIATAYVNQMIKINCRTIFSTHYHSLVDYFDHTSNIQLGHMSCLVENEGDLLNEKVIFLYKLDKGVCPKSYGFNVAQLAGLSQDILNEAAEVSKRLELLNKYRKWIKDLLSTNAIDEIRKLVAATTKF